MQRVSVVVMLGLLGFAGLANAQAAESGDPVSGRWMGDPGLSETSRSALTFDLVFDGNSRVSGSVTGPGPATFRTGSFDRATGALRLEVDVGDTGSTALFPFESSAVGGMVTGRVNGNGHTGTFRLTRAGA